ncbi:MAG: glycosyltransferase [Cecembia sp.]
MTTRFDINKDAFNYSHLTEPIPVTEQVWPDDILPVVCTQTMTYNHENYIKDCIEGILMQHTTFPVKIFIHDDASTDRTTEIIKEYISRYPQLITLFEQPENCYSKPNKYELRQPFYNLLNGKYIAICEGDDYWTDSLKLQKQVEFLEKNIDYVLCYQNWVELNDGNYNVPRVVFPSTHTRLFRNIELDYPKLERPILNGDALLQFLLQRKGKFKNISNLKPAVKRRDSGGVWNSLIRKKQIENRLETSEVVLKSLILDDRFKSDDLSYWKYRMVKDLKIAFWGNYIPKRKILTYFFRYSLGRELFRFFVDRFGNYLGNPSK